MLIFITAILGLFPAVFLTALQAILLVCVIWSVWHFRQLSASVLRGQLGWTHLALAQFFVFFLVNSIVFDALPGTPDHFRAVAIETWSVSLLALLLFTLFLALQDPVRLKTALINGLPIGLVLTFVAATVIYLAGLQGARIHIATPNPLVPPLWFLILTLVSFAWIGDMNSAHRALRAALFVMAGLMAVYAGARLVMIAWVVSGLLLTLYLVWLAPSGKRRLAVFAGAALLVVGALLLWAVDYLGGGLVSRRFSEFTQFDVSPAQLRDTFPRLVLWEAAQAVGATHMPWGAGNINERILIQTEIGWERWLRAHNSYLSYLIAGGPLALISGLILQLPVLQFLRSETRRVMAPVFIGLGVVLTLNCLTDSILQSGVAVQAYMVILLFMARAAQAGRGAS